MRETIYDSCKVEYNLGDTDIILQKKCMNILYGVCTSNGYIIKDTFKVVKRSPPILTNMQSGGVMYVYIDYSAEVVTLKKGEYVEAKITKLTPKLGNLAEIIVKSSYNGTNISVGDVILPNDLQMPGTKVSENDKVIVQILTSSFITGGEKIRAVGIIYANLTQDPSKYKLFYNKLHDYKEQQSEPSLPNLLEEPKVSSGEWCGENNIKDSKSGWEKEPDESLQKTEDEDQPSVKSGWRRGTEGSEFKATKMPKTSHPSKADGVEEPKVPNKRISGKTKITNLNKEQLVNIRV
jgi:hypothetical protein